MPPPGCWLCLVYLHKIRIICDHSCGLPLPHNITRAFILQEHNFSGFTASCEHGSLQWSPTGHMAWHGLPALVHLPAWPPAPPSMSAQPPARPGPGVLCPSWWAGPLSLREALTLRSPKAGLSPGIAPAPSCTRPSASPLAPN